MEGSPPKRFPCTQSSPTNAENPRLIRCVCIVHDPKKLCDDDADEEEVDDEADDNEVACKYEYEFDI